MGPAAVMWEKLIGPCAPVPGTDLGFGRSRRLGNNSGRAEFNATTNAWKTNLRLWQEKGNGKFYFNDWRWLGPPGPLISPNICSGLEVCATETKTLGSFLL